MSIPTIVYPVSYTLIDTFLVVFIKATSVHGKTSYNTITANAITECIKLGIAVYISSNEGSLGTLRAIVTDPGLMLRFAIPNLMYAVNNNIFHYSIGALPPALFVVAINAFRTLFTTFLQPFVSNKPLTQRQVVACILLLFSFVCASLPEVIKAAFAGSIRGSTFELLLYLSVIYSCISVVASLSQEKLLKDSKSLMVANIINYSIGVSFQVSGMIYDKRQHPETELFRGFDSWWVRAVPCLMACVGLSISFVLRYYDNIVKLLCSSVSVLLVNSITCSMIGESFINIYFFVGWLLTFPATYLYYVAPMAPAAPVATSAADAVDEQLKIDTNSLASSGNAKKLEADSENGTSPNEIASVKSVATGVFSPVKSELTSFAPPSTMATYSSRYRMFGGVFLAGMVVYSLTSSEGEIKSVEKKTNALVAESSSGNGDTNVHKHPLLPHYSYEGLQQVSDTCSLFEVPYSDSKSNLRSVESYSATYSAQYSTVDFVSGDVYFSCSKDLMVMGPDSKEYSDLMQKKNLAPNDWHTLDRTLWTQPSDYKDVHSLLALQSQNAQHLGQVEVEQRSRELLAAGQYKRLKWDVINSIVGAEAMYLWVYCPDHSDANLVTRPPKATQFQQQAPFTSKEETDIADYIRSLSIVQEKDTNNKPRFDTVLVLYLDAVSRVKLHHFYVRTMELLKRLLHETEPIERKTVEEASAPGKGGDYVHTAIELDRYHSVGINSEKNYPQFLTGVSPSDTKRFYTKEKLSAQLLSEGHKDLTLEEDISLRREPWLLDIATTLGFATTAGVTNCQHRCRSNCYELSKSHHGYEMGGYHSQYLVESPVKDNSFRMPAAHNFPTSSYCEAQYRAHLGEKSCSTCHKNGGIRGSTAAGHSSAISPAAEPFWIANKLGMSHLLDWWRVWLASTSKPAAEAQQPRFGVVVLEETHAQDFMDSFDSELAQFIDNVLRYRTLFGSANLAMVVMSDHGLHFTSEFKVPTGKIANKQPFNFMLLPKQYLRSNPEEARRLLHNSKALTTPYDLRATVGYWLSGRDWSADALRKTVQQQAVDSKEVSMTRALRKHVFATEYGNGLMNNYLAFNRSCDAAGIPQEFCACNLQPCDIKTKNLIRYSSKDIVTFINNRIAEPTPEAVAVCKPLTASEIIFVPGFDDCLSSGTTVVANAYIQRQMRLISISYVYNAQRTKLIVQNVNTISNYGTAWATCAAELKTRNIANNIQDDNFQFCLCDDTPTMTSFAAGIVNALNF